MSDQRDIELRTDAASRIGRTLGNLIAAVLVISIVLAYLRL